MVFILLIMFMLGMMLSIFWGMNWITEDFTDEEKEEVWKHLYDGFNNYKQ